MPGDTYLSAGVDVDAAEAIKERIGAFSRITHGPQVLQATGGFAGVYKLDGYSDPVLVSSADNVGTKLKIGSALGHYESLGMDVVNLNVGDILTKGARPLFFLDYMSMDRLDGQMVESLLRGMAWACREAGCSLVGGETAQTPGVYVGDAFDLVGFLVGAVEREALIDGPSTVREGDALLGIPSGGLHTNGFSLVRHIFGTDEDPTALYHRYDDLGHTLGEELLIPHRAYYPLLEPALPLVSALSHITGGGLVGKVPKVLPPGLGARLRLGSWEVNPIFPIIQREGDVEEAEMFRVFNMGLGMVLACSPDRVSRVQEAVPEALVVGEVVPHLDGERVVLVR